VVAAARLDNPAYCREKRQQLHRLKGFLANMGAKALFEACWSLEESLLMLSTGGETPTAPGVLDRSRQITETFNREVRRLKATGQRVSAVLRETPLPSPQPVVGQEDLVTELRNLDALLADYDLGAQEFLQGLLPRLERISPERARALSRAVASLNYSTASHLVTGFLKGETA